MQFAKLMAAFGGPNAGIVCSANEVSAIKADPETQRLIAVLPGIRLLGDSKDDQKNVVTPGRSWEAGADFEVIGRTVTGPTSGSMIEALARVEESYDEVAAKIG
jgi:orotidine-5'-phosphate decarboxylase